MTIEERFGRLEKRTKRLTTALTLMAMVPITIQVSACAKDPAGPSLTTCDVSEIIETPLGERDLTSCINLAFADLEGANLRNADLRNVYLLSANLKDAILEGADLMDTNLYGSQNEEACWSDCG